MDKNIKIFQEQFPSNESYWRSIILFGKNVASYKFALAKSLLEIAPLERDQISLEELAIPFSKYICEHLVDKGKQGTSGSSKFLEACRKFNQDIISKDELIEATTRLGFVNVIDAFHVVNNDPIPVNFFVKSYETNSKKIILTDELSKLQDLITFENLTSEIESRWNLIETAWELGISRNLINAHYDDLNELIYVFSKGNRRKDVTSARGALDGYQKGKCFYCFSDISTENSSELFCDVDHFFPHTLQPHIKNVNLNGVWNLVLSCKDCNRGSKGKIAKVPAPKFLERLHTRNEFLISSHHPLSETIINQTGRTLNDRIAFLKQMDSFAINHLIQRWETDQRSEAVF